MDWSNCHFEQTWWTWRHVIMSNHNDLPIMVFMQKEEKNKIWRFTMQHDTCMSHGHEHASCAWRWLRDTILCASRQGNCQWTLLCMTSVRMVPSVHERTLSNHYMLSSAHEWTLSNHYAWATIHAQAVKFSWWARYKQAASRDLRVKYVKLFKNPIYFHAKHNKTMRQLRV